MKVFQRLSLDNPRYEENLRLKLHATATVDEAGCWMWQGVINVKGYGVLSAFGKNAFAHRVSYRMFVNADPLPDGWTIDHLCRNRACINPEHLEAVPHVVNVRRGNTGAHMRERTHCKHGHEYTPENTRWRAGTNRNNCGRCCRSCERERSIIRRQNQKERVA